MKTDHRVKIESIEWLCNLSVQNNCNYALTINPNNEKLSISAIKIGLEKIERRIKSRCYKNQSKREEFFFIATFEYSYVDSYHIHLVLRVPDGTNIVFRNCIKKAIKNIFPKSSHRLESIFDVNDWLSYITKQQWKDDLYDNFYISQSDNFKT